MFQQIELETEILNYKAKNGNKFLKIKNPKI